MSAKVRANKAAAALVLSGNNLRIMHAVEAEWLLLLATLPNAAPRLVN